MVRYGLARVRGRSMLPTLRDGDLLLVRYGGVPRAGRLVVVEWPGRPPSVKRAFRPDGAGWWVERDNPDEGSDSWSLGAAQVRAVVAARVWPRLLPVRSGHVRPS